MPRHHLDIENIVNNKIIVLLSCLSLLPENIQGRFVIGLLVQTNRTDHLRVCVCVFVKVLENILSTRISSEALNKIVL